MTTTATTTTTAAAAAAAAAVSSKTHLTQREVEVELAGVYVVGLVNVVAGRVAAVREPLGHLATPIATQNHHYFATITLEQTQ